MSASEKTYPAHKRTDIWPDPIAQLGRLKARAAAQGRLIFLSLRSPLLLLISLLSLAAH